MKNPIKIILIIMAMVLANYSESFSQIRRHRAHVVRRTVNMRHSSRLILRRTAIVILAAQKNVRENRVYTGNLARAIAHQRFARRLFLRGFYLRAIHHSRRARMLAFMSIRANKNVVKTDWEFNDEENQAVQNIPSDQQLDKDLQADDPNASMKDEEFLDTILDDIDVKENE
jgi:hypothetical protein